MIQQNLRNGKNPVLLILLAVQAFPRSAVTQQLYGVSMKLRKDGASHVTPQAGVLQKGAS